MMKTYTADEAYRLLEEGNKRFVSDKGSGDMSLDRRISTARDGQNPYAVIVTCSDSRVVPEFIFSAGIGDLFVIRTAGNTIDACSLGSIDYAIEHLGCKLVVIMGHSGCGAVDAAMSGEHHGRITAITDVIRESIGTADDDRIACAMNISNSMKGVIYSLMHHDDVRYIGAIYDIKTGLVSFDS